MKTTSTALAAVVLSLSSCEHESGAADGGASNEDTTISRVVDTPSGDWAGRIEYTYGPDELLRHATYEFTTFTGYDGTIEEFVPTKCVRDYNVSEDGTMVLNSKVTTDLSSGEPVERTFYEPEITHWFTLVQARKEIQAEAATGQPAVPF